MTLAERVAAGFAIAAGLAFAATPYAIRLAGRMRFYDEPVGYKGHGRPTPYLGGIAVLGAFVLATAIVAGSWDRTAPLLSAAIALCALGTLDDRRSLSPLLRIAVELALGALMWAVDLGWDLHAGTLVDLVLTCVWVLGVVNAFNLFDNMDGAASAMALVVAGGAAVIGVVQGEVWIAAGAACLCGACAGFMPRNMAVPARIFLGDGGSMPLGFVVAVFVMAAAGTSTAAWRSLLVALLLVGIPALDTSLVIVSRRRRGVSVLQGGRDHLTHRTLRYLSNPRAVALALGVAQAALSVLAVLARRGEAALVVLGASAYLLAAGAAIIVLDTQTFPAPSTQAPAPPPRLSKRALACLVVLGLGTGVSPFFFAYFDTAVWVPAGLGVTLVGAIAVVLAPPRLTAPAILCVAGLLGLGAWSLASSAWAESVENAVVSGNRWLAYGALLVLTIALVSHDRRAAVLLGAAEVGILAVAVSVLVRLLGSDPGSLFLGGRLESPLGYINGEGCLFAVALWPCAALLEHRRAAVAGAGAGLATLLACLALLTQSRGTALALLGSLVLVMALVPGRLPRAYGLLVVAAGVALAGTDLLHVYEHRADAALPAGVGHAAGRAALIASLAVGVVWAALVAGFSRLAAPAPLRARARRAGALALALAALAAVGVGIASAHRVSREVSGQWHAFVHLGEPGEAGRSAAAGQTRLLSGGGNRYDYWRVAWRVFGDHPFAGVGAGNYARPYYERRATVEDVDQPHSIWLQTLSELGLAGFLLLCAFVAGVLWGAARMREGAARMPLRRGLLTAGLGAFGAWLVQASVDWMALLPGLTAVALIAACVLVWQRPAPTRLLEPAQADPRRTPRRALAAAAVAAVLIVLIVAGASLSRQGLAQIYRERAQHELARDPAASLSDANRSLSIDSDAVTTYYAKAAALARYDQAAAAEAALRRAIALEPRNFVTWALLGDVAERLRRPAAARAYYARAHVLNPRDAGLAGLAAPPRGPAR
ncbi:MAG TPA: O-antigen ligase family protein [Solirubrobacteraceae bacterium]|nr:O-antigen ligase family protein [Solirubrobacteraceae bacterium]